MIGLPLCDRASGARAKDSVDGSLIVALLSEHLLHLCGDIAGSSVAIAEDRTIVRVIIVIGIVTVGGIPPAVIPEVIAASVDDEPVEMRRPPDAIVTDTPVKLARALE